MFKRWNMFMIILTYDLMILGTFLTRSGVLSSVHSFAQSAIGPLFFAFIGITLTASVYLLSQRWNDLKAEGQLASEYSREALFLVNNLLFLSILVVCFWGVMFPIISEVFTGQKVTVGPIFYERATGPLWLALLFLMGVAPLSAWRASTGRTLGKAMWKPGAAAVVLTAMTAVLTGVTKVMPLLTILFSFFVGAVTVYEFYRGAQARSRRAGENFFEALWRLAGRNRRRYGGYIIHVGVILMAVGIMGLEAFQSETQGTVPLGGEIALGEYTMRYDSLAVFDRLEENQNVARAVVKVYKNGNFVGEIYPRRDFFYDANQSMTIPGLRSTLEDDFYVILIDWQEISTQNATFKVFHNPLVNWLWFGSIVFILGTLVAAWPEAEPETQRRTSKARAAVKA
jgi:cytochrome c-type biogenesis protein CcmF